MGFGACRRMAPIPRSGHFLKGQSTSACVVLGSPRNDRDPEKAIVITPASYDMYVRQRVPCDAR
jgi:hypothetical protein